MTKKKELEIAKIIAHNENTLNYVLAKEKRVEGWPEIEQEYESWVAGVIHRFNLHGINVPKRLMTKQTAPNYIEMCNIQQIKDKFKKYGFKKSDFKGSGLYLNNEVTLLVMSYKGKICTSYKLCVYVVPYENTILSVVVPIKIDKRG